MNKTLLKSVREYKKQSILAPILVILEVLMEVLIPMEMANIIDIGMTSGDLHYIIQRGVILVVMAMLSLFFGISAGNMAAVAGAGYAKNLRHDIFYKVQEFSFKNIDHFALWRCRKCLYIFTPVHQSLSTRRNHARYHPQGWF